MMNWKRFGSKKSWPNYKVLSRHSPGRTTENHEKVNQDSRSPEPKSVPGRPEYGGSDVEQRSLYPRPAPGVRIIVRANSGTSKIEDTRPQLCSCTRLHLVG
jgi:hypothetical protein